jgi:pimeloyl-ACP methyl ester carboxylesterase
MEIVACGIQALYYLLATWRAPSELRLERLPGGGKDSEMMVLSPFRFLHQLARVLGALSLVLTLLCIVFLGLAVTLKAIEVPTLVMQGDDDQIVPYKDAVLLQAKLIKSSTLKVYPAYPHGMLSVHADVINPDLLAFIKS